MGSGIIVCGLNGAGKSTIGKKLAAQLNYSHIDIEDLYFPNTDSSYPYNSARSTQEVQTLLEQHIHNEPHFVLSAVKGSYGQKVVQSLEAAVYVEVPKEIRMKRIRERSFKQFGSRILKGCDLHEREEEFFRFAQARSESTVSDWLGTLSCPILKIDGTVSVDDSVETILEWLSWKEAQQ